jgi:hypothetical protein
LTNQDELKRDPTQISGLRSGPFQETRNSKPTNA